MKTKTGVQLIADERQFKQIERHGFTAEHHANNPQWYANGQLISAAHMISEYDADDEISYLYRDMPPLNWDKEWWQRLCDQPKMDRLIMAGAFIASEIDRLNYLKANENQSSESL